MFGVKAFDTQFLIQWMRENQVFEILFDPKKTHLQLVQRTTDILKMLANENDLKDEELSMFWNLGKTEYKLEIYKIINDMSYYLSQEHIDYLFNQILETPTEKMILEDF